MSLPSCAGIIVIDRDETILVSTKNNNYSFPKGKRHKKETSIDTAWRELMEETGLTKTNLEIIDDFTIDEYSNRGNIAIRYYVGKLIIKPTELTFDANELHTSKWIKITDAYNLEKFKNNRKEILKQAHDKLLIPKLLFVN